MSSKYGDIIELSFVRVMENVLKEISAYPTNELYKHLHKSRRMPILYFPKFATVEKVKIRKIPPVLFGYFRKVLKNISFENKQNKLKISLRAGRILKSCLDVCRWN